MGLNYREKFLIPKEFENIVQYLQGSDDSNELLLSKWSYLQPGYVTESNFSKYLSAMLWSEECAERMILEKFNMDEVELLKKKKNTFELKIEGLEERRPSIIENDEIDVFYKPDLGQKKVLYRGTVTKINKDSIEITKFKNRFLNTFKLVSSRIVNVRFVLNRFRYNIMHEAIDTLKEHTKFLFPIDSGVWRTQFALDHIQNEQIKFNPDQLQAVTQILNYPIDYPYILFGPPGTGKTATLVEAIYQLKTLTNAKILICAPSNAACDMLTKKLLTYCSPHELLRFYSKTGNKETIPKELIDISNLHEKFQLNSTSYKYRIIVCTLVMAKRFEKFGPDVVMVDEAGQALETEIYIPLSICRNGGLIIAGDPKQLGAICISNVAKKFNFEKSLLERLMDSPLYQSHDPNYITMLKICYRCHPNIIKVPNELFYDNKLIYTWSNDPISTIFVSGYLPGATTSKLPGQSAEFYPVMAWDQRDAGSPSYFNPKEVDTVYNLVQVLLNEIPLSESHKIVQQDIGIVTPYARQLHKLRNKLESCQLSDVEIGTTESFQGSEKRIIIISTVRSKKKLLLRDARCNLGFVSHEKRFNVALTRAKSKLIVVGNPLVLSTDDNWNAFIKHCKKVNRQPFSSHPRPPPRKNKTEKANKLQTKPLPEITKPLQSKSISSFNGQANPTASKTANLLQTEPISSFNVLQNPILTVVKPSQDQKPPLMTYNIPVDDYGLFNKEFKTVNHHSVTQNDTPRKVVYKCACEAPVVNPSQDQKPPWMTHNVPMVDYGQFNKEIRTVNHHSITQNDTLRKVVYKCACEAPVVKPSQDQKPPIMTYKIPENDYSYFNKASSTVNHHSVPQNDTLRKVVYQCACEAPVEHEEFEFGWKQKLPKPSTKDSKCVIL